MSTFIDFAIILIYICIIGGNKMTKISIYDINFKEPGPKIPLENITFEEVDTYSKKFKNSHAYHFSG